MKHLSVGIMIVLFSSLILAGCIPSSHSSLPGTVNEKQIEMVQEAINKYREDNDGLLPIKNKDYDTDVYIKYLIDFSKLVPTYLPSAPSTSFEEGGRFQYVIIEAETNPTVKIFDLMIPDKIREIQLLLMTQKYPPFKERLARNVFTLDFQELGYNEEPTVKSPYSGEELPIVINGQGELFIDYRKDLLRVLQEKKDLSLEIGEDIRYLLTENSYFVPAYSLPYTIDEKGDPIFLDM